MINSSESAASAAIFQHHPISGQGGKVGVLAVFNTTSVFGEGPDLIAGIRL